MSEQKTDKTASKPSAGKSANPGKSPVAEKKPAATQSQSDKSAPDTERKAPNPPVDKASVETGRLASRRVWPD